MPVPVLKATTAHSETFAGVTYHIDGELVPVLHLELSGMPVYFEHYILLWKDLRVRIGIRPLARESTCASISSSPPPAALATPLRA